MNSLTQLEIYNSSESDNDESHVSTKLPVPTEFRLDNTDSKNELIREEDADGRIRNFPHERGIWATYIYLPINPSFEFMDYIKCLKTCLNSLNLKLVDDFHISLSKTVILRHHWIQGLVDSLKNSLLDICTFNLQLGGLKAYLNEQKSRTFLSLTVNEGIEDLEHIVSKLDKCLEEYKLESFHKDPSFHLSLLWCPGDKYNTINESIKNLPIELSSFNLSIKVSHCVCLSGNKSFSFNFCEFSQIMS